ncbi:MAG: polyphosphate kinase 2 [Alphaproteobacteria bacterium]
MSRYKDQLIALQAGLVALQQQAIASGERIVVVLEGRDTAGKDEAIKRIAEHMSVRNTRIVALPRPSDVQRGQWYFQRYIDQLPTAGEVVIFNRSWYNRAGVEVVMGFSTPEEQAQFLEQAPDVEKLLVDSGIRLIKLWLDVSREEQAKRLKARRTDPLKALKISPLDGVAEDRWKDYTKARDRMLLATHTPHAPWICVRADHKKPARLAIIRHLLLTLGGKDKTLRKVAGENDPAVLFEFEAAALADGRLER